MHARSWVQWIGAGLGCAIAASSAVLHAQDPATDEPPSGAQEAPAPSAAAEPAPDEPPPATDAASDPSTAPTAAEPPSSAPPPEAAAPGATLSVEARVDAPASDIPPAAPDTPTVLTGSHIPRPILAIDGAFIIDSPLSTSIQDRDYLQLRRQLGGIAPPDTTTALGLGAAGTSPSSSLGIAQLRFQPTLVLLNGRRLVAAPFPGPDGGDYVDLNQLPITLIDRVETSRGLAAGLYGDGAVGGAVNFITHRDYDGIEIEAGVQATDKFDQHEEDVTLTVGLGSERSGMNAMISYFTREPLAASDRDWIGDRQDRTESLVSNPATFQPLVNYVEFPFPDPFCDLARNAGHSSGTELRIPLFGKPETADGRNALDLVPTSPIDYRGRYRMFDTTRGDSDGVLEAYETSTYCAGDFTSVQDLVIDEQRIQTYATLWHALGDHAEGFAEVGYYRSDNENRTAPSYPVTRTAADPYSDLRILIPPDHADQPVQYPGFSTNPDDPPAARAPNSQFLVGRVVGLHAGAGLNTRTVDVLRGVVGVRGDFEKLAEGSVLETWDWELAGVYSASDATTRVSDILLDKLAQALASCSATTLDNDVASPTYGMQVPSTIKDRQEAGCYNPFYNSVTNNVAIDPLDLSNRTVANQRGFIASDSEAMQNITGFGLQDGGYICDPNDPDLPCPAQFDLDGDGSYELAGTPNTQQVIDRLTGEHITEEHRTLGTVDAILHGNAVEWDRGGLSFGVGGQYRRETLRIDYDAAFNRRLYAFVFGAPDVPPVGRHVGAGFGELRLRVLDGLFELQLPAFRVEHFDDVGTGVSGLAGIAVRPLAAAATPPEALEWLLVRAHAGHGHRAPSLLQLHGTHTEFHSAEFADRLHFIPHQVLGNPDLGFEKYTTVSGGLQWDYAGIHVGADFWMTMIDDVIGSDNLQTLLRDCEAQYTSMSVDCPEIILLTGQRTLNHVESEFDNLAEVDTNGIDGAVGYTLDTKRRGLGNVGTFEIAVQGTFLNQYLIKSPRALREFYRPEGGTPGLRADDTRDYSQLSAEYDAAGFRNLENFAPPMPKLRFAVPLSWTYEGHALGVTLRYIGEYNDDSEFTIEKYGLAENFGDLATAEGELISAWVVLDAGYGFTFGDEAWRTKLRVGVINLLDEPPPEAEGALGYDVGVHDPRGRLLYVRLSGEF
jgi:outer membrane receptor protein involved in Fe transport